MGGNDNGADDSIISGGGCVSGTICEAGAAGGDGGQGGIGGLIWGNGGTGGDGGYGFASGGDATGGDGGAGNSFFGLLGEGGAGGWGGSAISQEFGTRVMPPAATAVPAVAVARCGAMVALAAGRWLPLPRRHRGVDLRHVDCDRW